MRKLFLKSILAVFALFLLTGNAHAQAYGKAYMVTGNGSYTLSNYDAINDEYNYAQGETPYVYIKLKLSELKLTSPLKVLWSWSSFADPYNTEIQYQVFNINGQAGDKEIWSGAPEPWWTNNGGPGKWTVDIAWLNAQGALGTTTATFNVTPEPLSSALFLFGGVPVAAALLRKSKKRTV